MGRRRSGPSAESCGCGSAGRSLPPRWDEFAADTAHYHEVENRLDKSIGEIFVVRERLLETYELIFEGDREASDKARRRLHRLFRSLMPLTRDLEFLPFLPRRRRRGRAA